MTECESMLKELEEKATRLASAAKAAKAPQPRPRSRRPRSRPQAWTRGSSRLNPRSGSRGGDRCADVSDCAVDAWKVEAKAARQDATSQVLDDIARGTLHRHASLACGRPLPKVRWSVR